MKTSPRPDHPPQHGSSGVTSPPPAEQVSPVFCTAATFRVCFKSSPPAGTFGKDYGPDLAAWLAPRRVDPFRLDPLRPARNPTARDFVFGIGPRIDLLIGQATVIHVNADAGRTLGASLALTPRLSHLMCGLALRF